MKISTKITRRGFFKIFGMMGPAVATSQIVHPEPPPLPKTPYRRVALTEVYIAGFRYYDGMKSDVFCDLRVGDVLDLRREPDNPHDPCAIAIYTGTQYKLGYVPRAENLTPALIADQAVPLCAEIISLAPETPPWRQVFIRVFQLVLDDIEPA